jgi:CBS domain containing-hemolysin-like protein
MALSTLEIVVRLIAGVALILANAFFVAIEFGLTRARQYPESEFDEPGLRRAWEMTQDLELYLTSCQVGITASSIAVGIVAEPALAALFHPVFENTALASAGAGAVLAFLIINLVHLTHGEQTPTYLGVERSKFVCRYGATPLYYFYRSIAPIITLGDWVAKATLRLFGVEMSGEWLETEVETIESRAELRNRLGEVLVAGGLDEERQEEILNALDVGEEPIGEHVVEPERIVALSTDDDAATNLDRMESAPHTRYPLVGGNLEDFRGIVYVPELLEHWEEVEAGELDFEALAHDPLWFEADTTVSDAIDEFQAKRQELAYVREDGELVGMVTVTDALEAVMGDVRDPIDERIGIS